MIRNVPSHERYMCCGWRGAKFSTFYIPPPLGMVVTVILTSILLLERIFVAGDSTLLMRENTTKRITTKCLLVIF